MEEQQTEKGIDRRNFIRVAGAGLTAASVALTPAERAIAQFKTDRIGSTALRRARGRFERFSSSARAADGAAVAAAVVRRPGLRRRRRRQRGRPGQRRRRVRRRLAAAVTPRRSSAIACQRRMVDRADEGESEITMLDFPQFTKDTFPA